MTSEAQKRAGRKYDQENTLVVTLKLNKKTDAEIIAQLQRIGNRQGYIKSLILDDIAKKPKKSRK